MSKYKGPSLDELTDDPTHEDDARWAYPISKERAYLAWPCVYEWTDGRGTHRCNTRRDEHASEPEQSAFPDLDITDHEFEAAS